MLQQVTVLKFLEENILNIGKFHITQLCFVNSYSEEEIPPCHTFFCLQVIGIKRANSI